jgi:predicted lactoylglutathione lyase
VFVHDSIILVLIIVLLVVWLFTATYINNLKFQIAQSQGRNLVEVALGRQQSRAHRTLVRAVINMAGKPLTPGFEEAVMLAAWNNDDIELRRLLS